ncbi:POZ-, AT hook-, and zinc finger-containing protein 1 isoform X1 [Denticeps clupeoides]|uniref:POZ-, AT hook-, and zinc finger-containing protein 1 isoform X1 n=1 Tax=Denticeps clupeoides TaxID=299321 RepID=UPI0010A4C5DF|nr:POZ-, AT hook-, and zinc finger-containing protein 1-like isoform X1 [Denticeps clupeoides]
MERIAEQPWSSSYTYQVRQHSAEMLHNLDAQRKDGGRFCDVILRVGDESFPAHKAVLAACSEYFESVFSCQAETDSESKELEMHTISAKVFKDILDFAYTSRIVVRLECFPELMTAAKFLLMRSVIEICQEVIKQSNVQILVPPSRAGDVSFPRAATASDLSYAAPSDGPGGTLANGAVFPGSGQAHDADADASQAVAPDVTGSPFPGAGSPGSKRGRGRPKKPAAMEPVLFHSGHASKETGVFPCGICGKIFTEAVRLRNHEAQHDTPAMASPSGLLENGVPADGAVDGGRKRERIRRHVGCDICGKVFRDVYHLNRHKLSHSGEKPYACQVCGLRFKRKDRMSYHVRSHDGSVGKPYVCQSCGKGFSRPDHLNGHIKQVHTTERPHKCQICNASFATRDRLRSHLACHEDKIPCQVCGKFLRAAYMTDHLKKHSEGPHNYCSICNKGFSTASYLKVHIKTHHGSSLLSAPATHAFPDPHGEPQTHNGAPYPMGRQCAVEDLCTSHRLLVPFPEQEGGRFHGLARPPVIPQPGPATLSLQPELFLGKPGGTPYFWECRTTGGPGFLGLHGPLAEGQENSGKCPHQDSEGSDTSFGELSNGTELKSPHKVEGEELSTAFICNGVSRTSTDVSSVAVSPPKHKVDPDKKYPCSDCGQAFRTKSYLNKHYQRMHGGSAHKGTGVSGGPGVGDMAASLSSPFSPQQNMSLLESFGFQIVQSAFASSLVDSEVGSSGIGLGEK